MRLSLALFLYMISAISQYTSANPPDYPPLDQFKSIIGQEKAVAKFYVVYYSEYFKKYYGGTCAASFVSSHQLLTAAHCVNHDNIVRTEIIPDQGDVLTEMQFDWFKKSENFPAYNYEFYTKQQMDLAANDVLLITLKTKVPTQIQFYDLYKPSPETLIGKNVKIIGYPRAYQNKKNAYDNSSKFSTGSICKIIDFYNGVLYSDCLPQQGLSGGPVVYTDEHGKEWLAGILSSFSRSSVERYGSKISPISNKSWLLQLLKK